MISCNRCGRELTNDDSILRGIGPVCRAKLLRKYDNQKAPLCDYSIEIIEGHDIVLIHEHDNPKDPKVSLTNCVEHIINRVVNDYGLCTSTFRFVQHSAHRPDLFGGYEHYDLVDLTKPLLAWRYLWHSDAEGEHQLFSRQLLIDRVLSHRIGEHQVLNKEIRESLNT